MWFTVIESLAPYADQRADNYIIILQMSCTIKKGSDNVRTYQSDLGLLNFGVEGVRRGVGVGPWNTGALFAASKSAICRIEKLN